MKIKDIYPGFDLKIFYESDFSNTVIYTIRDGCMYKIATNDFILSIPINIWNSDAKILHNIIMPRNIKEWTFKKVKLIDWHPLIFKHIHDKKYYAFIKVLK